MNFLGYDVTGLDVEAWVRAAQALYGAAAILWLLVALWQRSPRLLLAGVLLANAWVFVVTNFPLQRLYGLGPSRDRVNNVGMSQVVAVGSPVFHTPQAGQLHFEPLWGLLMAGLSGFNPERLLAIYAFMPLVLVLAFVLALERGLRPPRACASGAPAREPGGGAWERAVVAGFATLLCAGPLDYLSGYRVTWAMMFLLKPNHALGLVLLPLVLRAVAGVRSLRGAVAAGLLLHVMGWAFVIHMGLLGAGLALYVLMALVARDDWRREARDVGVVLAINALAVSPYLYMLFTGYPLLVPRAGAEVPAWSPHLLEVTFRAGWLFPLSLWGVRVLWRRGRLERLWAAQAVSAFVMWAACLALSQLRLAREMDEFYQWARFLVAISAGFGAWDLARRVAGAWQRREGWLASLGRPALAAGVMAAVLPSTLPYWWDPARMDPYFPGSLTPLPAVFTGPTAWLRAHSAPEDVVAGDRNYMPWVSALAARRVLLSARLNAPRDHAARARLEAALARGVQDEETRAAVEHYRVRFVVATPPWLQDHGVELDDLAGRPDLRLEHVSREGSGEFVAVFSVLPGARAAAPLRVVGS